MIFVRLFTRKESCLKKLPPSIYALLLSLFLLVACSSAMETALVVAQTDVIATRPASSPVPTIIRDIQTVPTSFATNTPQDIDQSRYDCSLDLTHASRQYTVIATVDYAAKSVDVAQRVVYRNDTADDLMSLAFAIEANHYHAFNLGTVIYEGTALATNLSSNQLTVSLLEALPSGCTVMLDMQFSVQLMPIAVENAYKGYLGYSERQMNLGHWLPTIAPRRSGEWLIHPPQQVGEQTVLEQADWDVIVHVDNARDSVNVAAPGRVARIGDNGWRFQLQGGRDFAMSIGEDYRIDTVTTASGVTIDLFSFPDAVVQTDSGLLDGAKHALEQAHLAFDQYEALYGSYPYERAVIVQGDFADGMEFSGLVYVGTRWFYGFTGGIRNYLTLITVHELSHQWWYAKVGNDAAQAPWLDESLATYSEYIFLEEYYPDDKAWWWTFRVDTYSPTGHIDDDVYAFSDARSYINAIYLRGVHMLHDVRETIGTEPFFAWIAQYAASGAGRIASPSLIWSLLEATDYANTADVRSQYFSQPDILPQNADGDSFTSP